MNFSFFKRKPEKPNLSEEWNRLGEQYTSEVNAMVEFGEANGWDNWKGPDPVDKRDYLAAEVIRLLHASNLNNTVDWFRKSFAPAHSPFIPYFEKKGQSIQQLHYVDGEKIIFVIGTPWQKRKACVLDGKHLLKLDEAILGFGKSKRNNVFAVLTEGRIVTTQGWQGDVIETFHLSVTANLAITELIPFNDGKKILIVSSDGIYIISRDDEKLIHPIPDEDGNTNIDMENGTISCDNQYIVVGDQCSDHRVMDADGKQLGEIGPQSSYPHFCLFSDDDSQLITNSCHFYNGVTIGVATRHLNGIKINAWENSEQFWVVDEGMRVYHGLSHQGIYILGDAHGYVKAFDLDGTCIWRHFVGSTISGLTIADDGKTLWVASCTGIVHKLKLGVGHRDKQTIGTGNHYEEFRLIFWKDERPMFW